MPEGHWKRLATSSVLLAVVVLVAGALLALIGSTVFPQSGMFVWAAVLLLVFLLLQLVIFRLLGLRSRADDAQDSDAAGARIGATAHARDATIAGDAVEAVEAVDAVEAVEAEDAEDAQDGTRDWRAWRG
jgi:hypothetical protein